MSKYSKARQDLIDMYVKSLEENEIPWEKMWNTSQPINGAEGYKYNGINNLILSYVAEKRGYKDNRWCTYNQIFKNKWKFNTDAKGQGVSVEFWYMFDKQERKYYKMDDYKKIIEKDPTKEKDFILLPRNSKVFNADLIDGIPPREKIEKEIKPFNYINNIISNFGVDYKEEGESAYYDNVEDKIVIPPSKTFKNAYAYYATQLHELAHSTGASKRLGRQIRNPFGSENYAKEELRAEISSSFLMQKLNLEYDQKHLDNHKNYIKSWLKIIKDKPQELFSAISEADKIVDYMEQNSIKKEKNIDMELEIDYE